jgi:hypothetical protein
MLQNLVEIPDPLKAMLAVVITIAVTQVLKILGDALRFDLSGYAAQVSSAIVAAILVLANAGLSHVPAGFEQIVNALLVLLASWGGYKLIKQFQAPKG